MFGYITPLKEELKIREYETFKSYYCGLCFHIKKQFGNIPRLSLNYDMTFLGLLLDSLVISEGTLSKQRCMAHPATKKPMLLNREALSYAAEMNVTLVYYKLLDDISDNKTYKSKLFAKILTPYHRHFSKEILSIQETIIMELKRLQTYESKLCFSSIDEICDPFALIVASILKEYPYPLHEDSSKLRNDLFSFGYALGKWIYLIDALDDLEKDMKEKKFNPLSVLYNEEHLTYEKLFTKIQKTIAFTILNCAATCEELFYKLPIKRHKEILENIILLGMMDQYTKITEPCNCEGTKKRKESFK